MAARWRHLDTKKQQYYVCENITRRMAFGDVKGRNAAPVELSSFVISALEDQRTRVARWQLSSEAWEDNNLIFPNSSTGKPWTHSYVRKVFADTCEMAGVRYRPPHNMRHTCASLLLHQGENLKLVSKQLRHADPKITLSTYAHLLPDAGQEALERLDAALLSASNNHLLGVSPVESPRNTKRREPAPSPLPASATSVAYSRPHKPRSQNPLLTQIRSILRPERVCPRKDRYAEAMGMVRVLAEV
jgi:hypothetical protein